jgi:hypothetical protein
VEPILTSKMELRSSVNAVIEEEEEEKKRKE